MIFKRGNEQKTVNTNVNFLTCSGVPALGPGVEEEAGREMREERGEKREDGREVRGARTETTEAVVELPLTDGGSSSLEPSVIPERRKSRIHYVRWTMVVAVVVVLLAVSPAVVALFRTGIAASSAKSAVKETAIKLQEKDLVGAQMALNTAIDQVQIASDSLKGMGYWRDVPGIGTQIRALEDASNSGLQALSAGRSLLGVLQGVIGAAETGEQALEQVQVSVSPDRSFKDLSAEEKRAMLARLDRALPDLKEAEAKIDIAVDAWSRIPQDRLIAPIRSAFAPIAEALPRIKRTIDEATPLMELFVPLAGYPEAKTYVVLLQNTDEIRPTGGFIGTVGRLTVDAGEVKEFSFEDVYALDNRASGVWTDVPPDPIQKYLGMGLWFFRDSNWSPDFPTSAERLLDAYSRELAVRDGAMSKKPDGVIAINPPLFTKLMQIAGPIEIDGVTFDAETYFDLLEYQVEQAWLEKGLSVDQRKIILTKLGDELFRRLTLLPASRWPDLLDVLTDTLERKQVMVYVSEPKTLSLLDSFGWSGRMKSTETDFLSVIDANLAALKTDGVMQKSVRYSIAPNGEGDLIATVTLNYKNQATRLANGDPTNFKYTRYRSYTRIYVPEGAELISSEGAMLNDRYQTGGRLVEGTVDVTHELGKTVFGAFWSIEPNTSQALRFTYRLPKSVVDNIRAGTYSLDWQKQSGNDAVGLTLDLSFGKTLQSAVPAEDSSEWGDASYRVETNSLTDRRFDLTF